MNCECDKLMEVQRFGGYLHYKDTLNKMRDNTENGFFDIISEN